MIVAVTSTSPLWYLTRATGLVSVILLSISVVLGVTVRSGWKRPGWPRFASAGLHRYVSLLVVVVLAIHILTAELDTYAPVGWASVLIPFASSYRPVWLGLGTCAFDLLLAVIVTSLLRVRIKYQWWRGVHWAAYLAWPIAMAHGLGTGTDARLGWTQVIYLACAELVLASVSWRLVQGWPSRIGGRIATGFSAVAILAGLGAWAYQGPMQSGWAKRAGTPATLLGTSRTAAASPTRTPASPTTTPPPPSPAGLPSLPFSDSLTGVLSQPQPGPGGQVTVSIRLRLSGPLPGSLNIDLQGQSFGSGVSMQASSVSLGTSASPGEFSGHIITLNGDYLVARVSDRSGLALELGVNLRVAPATGAVSGDMAVQRSDGRP